tara:strand:- start:139 stop:372 length:234 start_codon:yes stop_codon:yes gene_type:complete
MNSSHELITIYSGSEIQVILLRGLLEEEGIFSIIQNEFQSGIAAGFGGGTSNTIRLKIHEYNLEKAQPIIENFISDN